MISVFVPFDPPTATAQQKQFSAASGFMRSYDKKHVKAAKKLLAKTFLPYCPQEPLEGALSVLVVWCLPFPKSTPKQALLNRIRYKITRPDSDNLNKGIQDVLGNLTFAKRNEPKTSFWKDDSLIADLHVVKLESTVPGILLEITPLTQEPLARLRSHLQKYHPGFGIDTHATS